MIVSWKSCNHAFKRTHEEHDTIRHTQTSATTGHDNSLSKCITVMTAHIFDYQIGCHNHFSSNFFVLSFFVADAWIMKKWFYQSIFFIFNILPIYLKIRYLIAIFSKYLWLIKIYQSDILILKKVDASVFCFQIMQGTKNR